MIKKYLPYVVLWAVVISLLSCVPAPVKPESKEQIIAYNISAIAGIKRQLGNMLSRDELTVDQASEYYSKADYAKSKLELARKLIGNGLVDEGSAQIELALELINQLQLEINR